MSQEEKFDETVGYLHEQLRLEDQASPCVSRLAGRLTDMIVCCKSVADESKVRERLEFRSVGLRSEETRLMKLLCSTHTSATLREKKNGQRVLPCPSSKHQPAFVWRAVIAHIHMVWMELSTRMHTSQ